MRVGRVLTAIVLCAAAVWVVIATANIFLLLFLSILGALYLGALRDYLARRLRIPDLVAFWLAVVLTAGAVVGLVWLLVPPVVPYVTNTLTIMVPKGNPARVRSLSDLGNPDVRLAMPNPAFEGIVEQIKTSLE